MGDVIGSKGSKDPLTFLPRYEDIVPNEPYAELYGTTVPYERHESDFVEIAELSGDCSDRDRDSVQARKALRRKIRYG